MHFLVQISIWNGKIKLCSEAKMRECEMGWSHHTSRSESQQHECEKVASWIFCLGVVNIWMSWLTVCGRSRQVLWSVQTGSVVALGRLYPDCPGRLPVLMCGRSRQVLWSVQAGSVVALGRLYPSCLGRLPVLMCGRSRQILWSVQAGFVVTCGRCRQILWLLILS